MRIDAPQLLKRSAQYRLARRRSGRLRRMRAYEVDQVGKGNHRSDLAARKLRGQNLGSKSI